MHWRVSWASASGFSLTSPSIDQYILKTLSHLWINCRSSILLYQCMIVVIILIFANMGIFSIYIVALHSGDCSGPWASCFRKWFLAPISPLDGNENSETLLHIYKTAPIMMLIEKWLLCKQKISGNMVFVKNSKTLLHIHWTPPIIFQMMEESEIQVLEEDIFQPPG